jgi:orotate phosphoribosyltransferase
MLIRVEGTATGESEPMPVNPGAAAGAASSTGDLGSALRGYAMRGIPLAIIVSLALTGLLIFLRRLSEGRSSSLSGGITRR